jgi:hypothetical protein
VNIFYVIIPEMCLFIYLFIFVFKISPNELDSWYIHFKGLLDMFCCWRFAIWSRKFGGLLLEQNQRFVKKKLLWVCHFDVFLLVEQK